MKKVKNTKTPNTPHEAKEAVVLLNMGGPNNLFEVEVFLRNMFADPLILRIKSKFLRKMVANMIINARLQKVKENFNTIGGKSPLAEITYTLTQKLCELDNARFYTYAMRYVPPYAKNVVADLKEKNFEKITLFTMYPQYSTTTTLSSVRDFLAALDELDYHPKVEIVEDYGVDSAFIASCVEQIKEAQKDFAINEKFSDFILLLSAHSIPQSVVDDGDIYEGEIKKSADALKVALKEQKITFKDIIICYQSKVGPMKWLQPSTRDIIKKYHNEKLIIYPLAFTIDNYETNFELDIDNRALAGEIGVKKYIVCKCPNFSPIFVEAVTKLVRSKRKDINEANL
ncbi:ferrochelatase [Helicobacter sp. 23-1045]